MLVLNANAGNDTLRKYTWGLDLSGQRGNPTVTGLHSAGGVGGLLAAEETATAGAPKYWFFCDGNGNVTQILDPNDFWPEPTAHYEYDPYGNLIRALDVDGSGYVNTNLFRFSTKWWDTETGQYYYGYRYYDPRLGRWTSEDPLEEEDGYNLHRFLLNSPVDYYDPTGDRVAPPRTAPIVRPVPRGRGRQPRGRIAPLPIAGPGPEPAPIGDPNAVLTAPRQPVKPIQRQCSPCRCTQGKPGYARGHTPNSEAWAYEQRVCGNTNCSLSFTLPGISFPPVLNKPGLNIPASSGSAGYDAWSGRCDGRFMPSLVKECKHVNSDFTVAAVQWFGTDLPGLANQRLLALACGVQFVVYTNNADYAEAVKEVLGVTFPIEVQH